MQGFTLVEIMIVVAIIGVLLAVAVPNLLKARVTSQRRDCICNLKQLDGAKEQWAIERKKTATDIPGLTDLFSVHSGYIQKLPVCPANGTYSFNAVGVKATCSLGDIEGHTY